MRVIGEQDRIWGASLVLTSLPTVISGSHSSYFYITDCTRGGVIGGGTVEAANVAQTKVPLPIPTTALGGLPRLPSSFGGVLNHQGE